MDQHKCSDCKYYVQHYAKINNQGYRSVYCGHCHFPRAKNRKPDSPACEKFSELPPSTPSLEDQCIRRMFKTLIDVLQQYMSESHF